jgi:hypothetical protein
VNCRFRLVFSRERSEILHFNSPDLILTSPIALRKWNRKAPRISSIHWCNNLEAKPPAILAVHLVNNNSRNNNNTNDNKQRNSSRNYTCKYELVNSHNKVPSSSSKRFLNIYSNSLNSLNYLNINNNSIKNNSIIVKDRSNRKEPNFNNQQKILSENLSQKPRNRLLPSPTKEEKTERKAIEQG